jgi:hypothetical protein
VAPKRFNKISPKIQIIRDFFGNKIFSKANFGIFLAHLVCIKSEKEKCLETSKCISQDMHQFIIMIHQHFICEQCMAVPSLIVNFDEIWSSKFKELSNLVSELINPSPTL